MFTKCQPADEALVGGWTARARNAVPCGLSIDSRLREHPGPHFKMCAPFLSERLAKSFAAQLLRTVSPAAEVPC